MVNKKKILKCPRCKREAKREGSSAGLGRIDMFRKGRTKIICINCFTEFLNDNFYVEEMESHDE